MSTSLGAAATHTIWMRDALGPLQEQKAYSRSDGYILAKARVARPGIYLYKIDGRIVRQLVPREVLQDEVYLCSYVGKPLTVKHNPGPDGPHWHADELGDGLVAGSCGFARWCTADDAQDVDVYIWTRDGRAALEAGLEYFSPAYPARLQFFDEPQYDPEFGWHDAVQLERGEVNHVTLTDNPRGGYEMTIKKGDARHAHAQYLQQADAHHTQVRQPMYGAPQQPGVVYVPVADMNGAGAPSGGGGDQLTQQVAALTEAVNQQSEMMAKLLEMMGGKQVDAAGKGNEEDENMNAQQGDSERARIAYANERALVHRLADSLGVQLDEGKPNGELKLALVKARHPKVDPSKADLVDLLFDELADAATAQTSQADAASSRVQAQNAGLLGSARQRVIARQGRARPISMDEVRRAAAAE